MKEIMIKPNTLTDQVVEVYSKGRDILMEGKVDMPPNSQSEGFKNSEATSATAEKRDEMKRVVLKNLDERQDLPVEVKKAVEELIRENGAKGDSSTEKAREVIRNASLENVARIDAAAQLLKRILTEKQKEAILEAHTQGAGEVGKDNGVAGVYNYTKEQLLRKARILKEAGFSPEERRALMEAGIVGTQPVDNAGISDPSILTEMDAMNNSLKVELQSPPNVLMDALVSISKLTGVSRAEKQVAVDRITKRIFEEKEIFRKEKEKTDADQSLKYRFSFSLMPEEIELLINKPMDWVNGQFDQVYALAEEGQELNSPLIQNTQQKISLALDLIKYSNPENMKSFINESTTHLHLLQMRTAIGYKDMEQVKGAAGQLRAHGLLLGMALEGGKVGAMFNRFQDLLEETRLWSNKRHHVMLEDVLRVQKTIIAEQMELAKKGKGGFGDLSSIVQGSNAKDDFEKAADEKITDLSIKNAMNDITKTLAEMKAKGIMDASKEKDMQDTLDQIGRIKKIRETSANITRTVRTAYDVFVSSQRMGVIVSRGKYLLKDSSRYRSDPIGPLTVYNMEDLSFNRFDMYSPEQEEFVDRIKLDMAENYLKKQREIQKGQAELTREQKIDLGKRLFRDLFAVPDFFSSGWRIEGVIQALEQRFEANIADGFKDLGDFESSLSPKEKENYPMQLSDNEKMACKSKIIKERAVEKAKDFALFMRLRHSGQDQLSDSVNKEGIVKTKKTREEIWEKIRKYRPEEIIRLFRERENAKVSELYKQMSDLDPELGLNDLERLANRSSDEGGRGRDLTVYDKFKLKYGTIIGLLRQDGFNNVDGKGIPDPKQINLSILNPEQRALIDSVKGPGSADLLMKLSEAMQRFIGDNRLVDDLLTKNEFADIYVRSIIIDDALLDRLENEKSDVLSQPGLAELGYDPFSKTVGEAAAGNDTLTRSWNDTDNGIKAGNTLIKFIKEENLEEKTKIALDFANLASQYNGLGSKGMSECVRYTIGTYLNLTKLDMIWDVVGTNSMPFRVPISEAQRIFGTHIRPASRDELRKNYEHLRGFLNASTSKNREAMLEKKKEIEEEDLSSKYQEEAKMQTVLTLKEFREKKYREALKKLSLSKEEMQEAEDLGISTDEFKERKFGNKNLKQDARGIALPEDGIAQANKMNISVEEFKENMLIKEILIRALNEQFEKEEEDSKRFSKDLERLFETTGKDSTKRFAMRFILYLMLAVFGETYTIVKSGFKDPSK